MIIASKYISTKQRIAAKICFAVFVIKMMISATPIFVDVLDQGTILQVVLQLEIENTAKGNNPSEDLHEAGSKFFSSTLGSDFEPFIPLVDNSARERHYLKNEKLFQVFHPSVPTPPPNC